MSVKSRQNSEAYLKTVEVMRLLYAMYDYGDSENENIDNAREATMYKAWRLLFAQLGMREESVPFSDNKKRRVLRHSLENQFPCIRIQSFVDTVHSKLTDTLFMLELYCAFVLKKPEAIERINRLQNIFV